MKRFGIENTKALGIPVPELRKLSKVIKKDHTLALELWETNLHEARILASLIDDAALVTSSQFDNQSQLFPAFFVLSFPAVLR